MPKAGTPLVGALLRTEYESTERMRATVPPGCYIFVREICSQQQVGDVDERAVALSDHALLCAVARGERPRSASALPNDRYELRPTAVNSRAVIKPNSLTMLFLFGIQSQPGRGKSLRTSDFGWSSISTPALSVFRRSPRTDSHMLSQDAIDAPLLR
jgi:hypothetical protein